MKNDERILEVVSLTHSPSNPRVGQQFVALVELNYEVAQDNTEITVKFEKQRLVANSGGYLEARPTGMNYFVDGFEPQPVAIPKGTKFAISKPMVIRKDVSAPDGEQPVSFPEKLLLTAYVGSITDSFCTDIIKIYSTEVINRFLKISFLSDDLVLGQKVPNKSEKDVVGAISKKIKRGSPEFKALVKNENADVVFKDEEGTGADRIMTKKLGEKVDALAVLVKNEWSEIKLRITEAWDENDEHGINSVHYEARGVDITTSDKDGNKLGRLGRLAVKAGFDWVFYENSAHIHASVSK